MRFELKTCLVYGNSASAVTCKPLGVLITTLGVGKPVAVQTISTPCPSLTKMYGSSGWKEACGGSCTSNVDVSEVCPASFTAVH